MEISQAALMAACAEGGCMHAVCACQASHPYLGVEESLVPVERCGEGDGRCSDDTRRLLGFAGRREHLEDCCRWSIILGVRVRSAKKQAGTGELVSAGTGDGGEPERRSHPETYW